MRSRAMPTSPASSIPFKPLIMRGPNAGTISLKKYRQD